MRQRGAALAIIATAGLFLAGCASSEELEAYVDELQQVQADSACILLDAQAITDPELPELLACEKGNDNDGVPVLFTSWANPALNAVEEDLTGNDWVFAPVIAASTAYTDAQEYLPAVQRVIITLADECRNTVEVPVALAVKIAEPGADVLTLLKGAEIFGLLC